ncbi:MAG: single-stranded DNA-binding protein [Dehalococcoidales bacterium]|nr:single-stranded DNA-binding protein [Dehalococcoidales bacterium]
MASVNKIIIVGNVGSDPEMRFTPNGNPVTSFRVATNWRYTTSQGERREETEWFTVVAWNRLAEQCNQFLTKGRLVYAEGRLRTHTWEGQDGEKRFRNEIIADKVTFLDRQGNAAPAEEKTQESSTGEVDPEEIPFS